MPLILLSLPSWQKRLWCLPEKSNDHFIFKSMYFSNEEISNYLLFALLKRTAQMKKNLITFANVFFLFLPFFSIIWVTNITRMCLYNIQTKHFSCPSQISSYFLNSSCSSNKSLSDWHTCRTSVPSANFSNLFLRRVLIVSLYRLVLTSSVWARTVLRM